MCVGQKHRACTPSCQRLDQSLNKTTKALLEYGTCGEVRQQKLLILLFTLDLLIESTTLTILTLLMYHYLLYCMVTAN